MKASFHYVVKVNLIRYLTKDSIDFIKHEKIFEDDNAIAAREQAFKEYEEWIKDLYTGENIGRYTTDKQARIDFKRLLPNNQNQIKIDDTLIDFSNSLDYGIGVYFVIDKPFYQDWESEDIYDKAGDEILIHGLGTTDKYNDPLEISDALNNEILYYEEYNYDKGRFERTTNFYDWDLGGVEEIHFLETPFDWTGLDEKPKETGVEKSQNKTYEEIIANGEGNQVEFKPALLYNFKTDKPGISIKGKIATVICAFLNSNGGILFIGLDDDGKPQGLYKDFSLAGDKNPKDYFQNEFDQMIEYFLSFSVKSNITGQFYEIDDKNVFIVSVEPIKNRAVFVKGQNNEKEFWVRGNASNRKLTDIEEIVNYCLERQHMLFNK